MIVDDLRTIARWWPRVWRDGRGWLLFILLASPPLAFLQAAFPWFWQYAVDAIGGDGTSLPQVAAWTAGVGLAHAAGYVALQWARSVRNGAISATIRRRLLSAVAHADPSARAGWRTGDLVARVHDDAGEKLSWFLCSGVFRAYEAAWIGVACLAVMAWASPALTVWVVAPIPLLAVFQLVTQAGLSKRQAEVQRAISETTEVVETTFGVLRVVQAAGLVPFVHRRFEAQARAQRDAEIRAALLSSGLGLVFQYGWQFALVALLGFGGRAVIDGELTLGQYVTFEGLVSTLIWPMFDLGNLLARSAPTAVSLRRLDEVLALPPRPEVAEGTGGGVVAEALFVAAPDGTTLLADVDLQVRAGGFVALAGAVGSGKTVLLEALAGERPLASGRVVRGGPTALVPQDPVALMGTVRDNVLLGRDVPEDALDEAVAVSQLARDLPQLAAGLDTEVGERGVTLSGGQRQRLAWARALAGRPAVLLLDDATSALDAEVERALWTALGDDPARAVVAATHRPRVLASADEVVWLVGGRVADRGRHADLLARQPDYGRSYAG